MSQDSPFTPDGVFYSKRSYIPKRPVEPGQEATIIKHTLMDLSEIIPMAFFHPRYIHVTRNLYLGEDNLVFVPTPPPTIEIVALYVPISIQVKWFNETILRQPAGVISGAVEDFLRGQFKRYEEEQ